MENNIDSNSLELKETIEKQNLQIEALQNECKCLKEMLLQREKISILGELSAGIVHEIQNPLNFVNNFSKISFELLSEVSELIDSEKNKLSTEFTHDLVDLINLLLTNQQKIADNGKRIESIVKNMLSQSRGDSSEKIETDINALITENIALAYHAIRAGNKSFNTNIIRKLQANLPKIKIVPHEFSRVILNIATNACFATNEKLQKLGDTYIPEIIAKTELFENQIYITISDNGTGIPKSVIKKIYQPFFTTKPVGKGTGLGLSMSYDIITNIHKGRIEVSSIEGEYTQFTIVLPVN